MGPPARPGRASGMLIVLWSISEKIKTHEQAVREIVTWEIWKRFPLDDMSNVWEPKSFLSQTCQKWAEEGRKRNGYRLSLPSCFSLWKRVTMPQCRGLVRTLDNLDNQNSDAHSLIVLVYGLVPYFQYRVQTSKRLFPSEMTEVKPDPEHVEVLKRYFGHSKFRP